MSDTIKKPLFNADNAEEHFVNLCTYYKNEAKRIFERDNGGRHPSEQIYSAEYQKFLGMELALREVLEYFSKYELGVGEAGLADEFDTAELTTKEAIHIMENSRLVSEHFKDKALCAAYTLALSALHLQYAEEGEDE